jgi:hypothetical protein
VGGINNGFRIEPRRFRPNPSQIRPRLGVAADRYAGPTSRDPARPARARRLSHVRGRGGAAAAGGAAEQFAWFAPDEVSGDLIGFGPETLVPLLVNAATTAIG